MATDLVSGKLAAQAVLARRILGTGGALGEHDPGLPGAAAGDAAEPDGTPTLLLTAGMSIRGRGRRYCAVKVGQEAVMVCTLSCGPGGFPAHPVAPSSGTNRAAVSPGG